MKEEQERRSSSGESNRNVKIHDKQYTRITFLIMVCHSVLAKGGLRLTPRHSEGMKRLTVTAWQRQSQGHNTGNRMYVRVRQGDRLKRAALQQPD